MSYDSWPEAPYQQQQEAPECPDCGEMVDEDTRERSVECPECGYMDAFDWDAEAERRADRY